MAGLVISCTEVDNFAATSGETSLLQQLRFDHVSEQTFTELEWIKDEDKNNCTYKLG